jgi:predicted hydrocarbon binding protein
MGVSFITKLLISKQLRFEEGQIIFLEEPMVFVPIDFYVHLTKEILKKRREEMEVYLDAWKAGVIFMRRVAKRYSMKKFEERYKEAMDIISSAGFGDYQTLEFVPTKYAYFKIFNNPIAEKFYPSKEPIDHVLRGFNAGGGSPVHERIINTIETECKAVNGKFCIHLNAAREVLKQSKFKEFVEKQLDLNFLIKEQKKFLKEINYKEIKS